MNWDQIEGNWKNIVGQVKSTWGKLTDDDLRTIKGKRMSLEGKIQERYGMLKEDAERSVDEWLAKVGGERPVRPPTTSQLDAERAAGEGMGQGRYAPPKH